MIDTCDDNIIAMYHITANDRVMGAVDEAKKLTQTVLNSKCINEPEKNRIYVSLLCPFSNEKINTNSYAAKLAEISGGITYSAVDDVQPMQANARLMLADNVETVEKQDNSLATAITNSNINILGEGDNCKYKIVTSTGVVNGIALKRQLTKLGHTDSDEDGLTDWQEVDTDFIEKYIGETTLKYNNYLIKNSDLPTLLYMVNNYEFKPYMSNVKYDLAKYAVVSDPFDTWRILPIKSSPNDADSDNDGIIDKYDKNALKYCDNNDDILNGYDNAFVTFKLNKPNKIKLTGNTVELKAMPDNDSTTLKTIINSNSDDYIIEYVSITSNSSWARIQYDGIVGYVENNYVKVDDNNESLLRIMFSEKSILDGIYYLPYWHVSKDIDGDGKDDYNEKSVGNDDPIYTIHIKSANRCVDTSVSPTKRQEANSSYDSKQYLTISQSELGFLYAMSKDVGDYCGINRLDSGENCMFEWLLAVTMHESQCGMSFSPKTWKADDVVDSNKEATGYFQIVQISQDDYNNHLKNNQLISKWKDKSTRLDKSDEELIKCYYGNIVVACGIMYRFKNDYGFDTREQIFQNYATGKNDALEGYSNSEFIVLLDNIIIKYVDRWR